MTSPVPCGTQKIAAAASYQISNFLQPIKLGVIIDPLAPHTCNCKRIVLPLDKVQRGLSLAPFEPIDSVVAKSLTL